MSKHRDSYADQPWPFELGGLSEYSVTACDCQLRHDLGVKMPKKNQIISEYLLVIMNISIILVKKSYALCKLGGLFIMSIFLACTKFVEGSSNAHQQNQSFS